jgi:hypothetical protein
MVKMKNFIIFLTIILLTACAPDPRREAQAFATRTQAEQDAADRTQARQQSIDMHALEIQHQDAIAQEWEAGMNKVIHTAAVVSQFAVTLIILGAAIGMSWALIGTGKAAARFAEVRANLIPLNNTTHQFPLLISYAGKGKFSLSNPNTNSVLLLDTRSEPDRQMILGMSNTQYGGALAHESRLSLKPGEVSTIPAPFVEMANE